jgi:transcriptional regulator GlxA family with amidase domain
LATYCTREYLLTEAGLLDGRLATTPWAGAADFAGSVMVIWTAAI